MRFSNVFAVVATTLLGASMAQAAVVGGTYRIITGGWAARSYPSGGHQGDFEAEITLSPEFASTYEHWNINPDGNGNFIIANAMTGAKAHASQTLNAQVFADSNDQTAWQINDAGNDRYIIKIPFQDLLWSNTNRGSDRDNTITLRGSDGSNAQRFTLEKI